MDTPTPASSAVAEDLHERDEIAWLEMQARALRERRVNDLHWDKLAEEVEGTVADREAEVANRLETLVAHHIKSLVQPERYGWSWYHTMREQQRRIKRCLKRSPSLRPRLPRIFAEVYQDAVETAAEEMHKKVETVLLVLAERGPPLTLDYVLEFEPHEPREGD